MKSDDGVSDKILYKRGRQRTSEEWLQWSVMWTMMSVRCDGHIAFRKRGRTFGRTMKAEIADGVLGTLRQSGMDYLR